MPDVRESRTPSAPGRGARDYGVKWARGGLNPTQAKAPVRVAFIARFPALRARAGGGQRIRSTWGFPVDAAKSAALSSLKVTPTRTSTDTPSANS